MRKLRISKVVVLLLCLSVIALFAGCTWKVGPGSSGTKNDRTTENNSAGNNQNDDKQTGGDSTTDKQTGDEQVGGDSVTDKQSDGGVTVDDSEEPETICLYDTYKDDFMVGTIYTESSSYGKMYDTLKQNFNIITPENIMKPEYMQPDEGSFNFNKSDAMLEFAEKEGLKVHGHTLVWHQQTGNWLGFDVEREVAIEQLKSHISNVVGQYKGRIYSWDVVNEAIEDGRALPADGDWTKCLRETQWLKSIGPDYIALAFQFAHEADPDAVLYYNDYNMDDSKKAQVAAAMVKDLLEQGIPVHGIGMQGHYTTYTSPANVEKSIKLFSELGVKISISELDLGVKTAKATGLTEEEEKKQAEIFAKLFRVFKTYSDSIERVTFWGHIDTQSWRRETFPLIYNGNYTPKEALRAINNPDIYLESEDK